MSIFPPSYFPSIKYETEWAWQKARNNTAIIQSLARQFFEFVQKYGSFIHEIASAEHNVQRQAILTHQDQDYTTSEQK